MNTNISRLFALVFTVFFIAATCVGQAGDPASLDSLEITFYENDSTRYVAMNVHTEKFGCMDNNGNLIVPFEYDYLGKLSDGLRLAILDPMYGYLNEQGEVQIEIEYLGATHFRNGKAVAINKDGFGVIDRNNEIVIPFGYASLVTRDHEYYAFKKNGGKVGVMDAQEKVIIPALYQNVRLKNDSFWVAMIDRKFEIYNRSGEKHLIEKLDRIGRAGYSGYMSVDVEGKSGMIDEQFNWVVPPRYTAVSPLFDNYIGAKDSLGWRVYNANHEQVIDEVFDGISFLDRRHSIISEDKRKNIINQKGERLLDPSPEKMTKINGEKTLLHIDGYLYDGLSLNKIRPEKISFLSTRPSFIEGLLLVRMNGKCAVIDTSGNFRIPPDYDYCEDMLSTGYLKVKNKDNNKWGLVNLDNEVVIPIEYIDINREGGTKEKAKFWLYGETSRSYFSNQKILVSDIDSVVGYAGDFIFIKQKDKLGFINSYKNTVGVLEYDSVVTDRMPLVVVQEGKYGALDHEGNLDIPCQHNYLRAAGSFFIIKNGNKYGALSRENKVVLAPQFDKIEKGAFKIFGKAFLNDKIGLLDTNGTLLLPVEYDALDVKVNGQVTAQKGNETFRFDCMELQIKAMNGKSGIGN